MSNQKSDEINCLIFDSEKKIGHKIITYILWGTGA